MSSTTASSANPRGAKDTQISKRGGFSTLNINYKGGRGAESKGYGKSGHGMQSLGKVVATSRRMPNPASLPSLRSEHSGNDPSVTLVPAGGGGWKNSKDGKENKEETTSAADVPQKVEKEPPKPRPPPKRPMKGPPESPGRKFKSEFPSLDEQEGLSKRELEERHRGRREKGGSEGDKGDRGRGSTGDIHGGENWTQGQGGDKSWRDHPPPTSGGPPHGLPLGPPPGHFGPYPRGPYPPQYMMPPPNRHGMGPYSGMPPPMQGPGGGRYPPQHPMHFRPPYPPHPSFQQNPYEMPDPYKVHLPDDDVTRPPTVKQDELKQLDVGEEDEGGWAGPHDEVDYTKEVVFSDSSDEENEGKGKNASKKKRIKTRSETSRSAKRKDDTQKGSEHTRRSPPPDKQSEHSRPHPHHKSRDGDRESHDEGPPRHNMQQYSYPPYPQYAGYPGYPPMYPAPHGPTYPVPHPHGYPPPPHQRYPRRSHSDKDDLNWRHDDDSEKPKRSGEEKVEERPRILTKQNKQSRLTTADQEVESVMKGAVDKNLSLQRTASSSSDTPKHVTFQEESSEPIRSPTTEDQSSQVPTRRPPQKKLMLRKLGDQDGETQADKSDQASNRGGSKGRPKDLRNVRGDGKYSESGEELTPEVETKTRQTAWATKERKPANSKTLYEPEGKKSEAKFMKYQAQTRETSRGRTGSRGSQGSTTPTGDIEGGTDTPTDPNDVKVERSLEAARQSQSPTNNLAETSRQPEQRKTHSQELDKPSSHSKSQQDSKRAFPERPGPYREGRPKEERSGQHRDDRPSQRRDERSGQHRDDRPSQRREERTGQHREDRPSQRRDERSGQHRDDRPSQRREERSGQHREDRPSQRREERSGQHRDERSGHESKRGPSRENKRVFDNPRQERTGGHQKGREFSRQDSGGYDKRKDHRRDDHDSKTTRNHRGEDKHHLPDQRRDSHDRTHKEGEQKTQEFKQDTSEISQRPESKPDSLETEVLPPQGDSVKLQQRANEEHGDTQRDRREPKQVDRYQRGSGPNRRGDPRSGRNPTRERDDNRGDHRGERVTRPHQPKPLSGRGDWNEGGDTRKYPSQETKRGPPKQPVRDRDNRGPPPHKKNTSNEKPPTHKDLEQSEPSGGRPAHGYGEVFDIESGSDWDDDPPVLEADPELTVAERAKEGQPLLPTPPIEKRTYDSTRQEGGPYPNHPPRGNPSKRHFGNREGEFEEQRQEQPVQDLREKIRGGTSNRGRGKSYETRRDKRSLPEGARPDGKRPSSGHDRGKHAERITGINESVSKDLPKSRSRPIHDKLDAIPPSDSPTQVPLKTDFEKYDLNSHKVAIVDDIDIEGRFSPTGQGEFVQVTSKKAQKEKQRKEKEELRKQEEEKQREDEKRKRKVLSNKPTDKAPPSDNKPMSNWSNPDMVWGTPLLPVVSQAPGSHLNKSVTAANPPGCIGENLIPKQAVPYTAELISNSHISQDSYTLFGGPMSLPFHPTAYQHHQHPGGILESAIDSTVLTISPSRLNKEETQFAEDASNKSAPPDSDKSTPSNSNKSTLSVSDGMATEVKGKKEDTDRPKSDRSTKNLPPRLKPQQGGSGRGRGNRHSRDGGERKERKVGRQSHGNDRERSMQKERGQEQSQSKTNPKFQTTQPAVSGSAPPSTSTEPNKGRFYVHPQRRDGPQEQLDTKPQDSSAEGATQEEVSNQRPPSKVVPFEDHTPDTPTYVSVTTGQQPLRAGSSLAMRPERVSVGRGREDKDKCENTTNTQAHELSRPMSSSSTLSSNSVKGGEGIKRSRPPSKETVRPSTSRPPSATQHMKMSATVVSKTFSYAQALKSAGQPSSTSSSSLISSRSETPSGSPFCPPLTLDDKNSSRSSTPPSIATEKRPLVTSESPVSTKNEVQALSPMSFVDSIEDELEASLLDLEPTNSPIEKCHVESKEVCSEMNTEIIEVSNENTENMQDIKPLQSTLPVVAENSLTFEPNPTSVMSDNPVEKPEELVKGNQNVASSPNHVPPNTVVSPLAANTSVEKELQLHVSSDTDTRNTLTETTVIEVEETTEAPKEELLEVEGVAIPKQSVGSTTLPAHQAKGQSYPSTAVPVKAHPLHLPTAHVLPMPNTNVPHSLVHPHSVVQMNPAVQLLPQNQHLLLTSRPGDFQKQFSLMSTPNITSMPEPPFPGDGSALFRTPPVLPGHRPALPPPMPPVMSTKSNEQLEAIAKVREYMAASNAIDAQRKNKSSEMQSHANSGQRQFQQSIPETRANNHQHKVKQPVTRPQEGYPAYHSRPMPGQVSLPNQGGYLKQPPLLTQPPLTRPQSLLPGQPSSGQPPTPHVPQLTPQQYLLLKHAQAAQMQAALIQYQKQQQAIKMAAALESMRLSSQSGRQPPEPPTASYPGYSVPSALTTKPPTQTGVQPQVKSAFSPYHSKNMGELGRVTVQQVQRPPLPEMVQGIPQDVIHASRDQQLSQNVGHENCEDLGKSALSASATPFIPSSKPANVDGRQAVNTPSTRSGEPASGQDRPLLPPPVMYHPNMPVRPPPQPGFPAGTPGSAFIRQTQLPIPVPHSLQQLMPTQANAVALAAAVQQRKTSLTMGAGISRHYLPTTEAQLANQKMIALQQQQQILEQQHMLASQLSGDGTLSTSQQYNDHVSQRKLHFPPEHQPKHMSRANANHKTGGLKPDVTAPPGTLLTTSASVSMNNPRRALLPTPSTHPGGPLLLANAPRISQTGQPWQAPPRQVPLTHHPSSLLPLAAQEQLRASSLYSNTMTAGPGGPQH